MSNELYQQLEDLLAENKELVLKLKLADEEIATLKIDVGLLKDGQLELGVRLEDSDSETGRLRMQLKHNYDSMETLRRHQKYGKNS